MEFEKKSFRQMMQEAISDEVGLTDMAFVVIGALAGAAICTLAFVCTMAAIDYFTCTPITTVSKAVGDGQNTSNVIPCRFDALPIGQASGLIFTAFAALIGALAGYMVALRRRASAAPPPPPAPPPVLPPPGA